MRHLTHFLYSCAGLISVSCYGCEWNLPNNQNATCCTCFNEPARIAVNGDWDFYSTIHFLEWVSEQDGLDVGGNLHNPAIDEPRPHFLKYYHMDFDYHPGFQIALGMNCGNHDDWTIQAEYSYLHSENHGVASVPKILFNDIQPNFLSAEITIVPNQIFNHGYSFLKSTGKWKNKLDLVDLDVRRSYLLGKKLVMTPLFGIRSGRIDQQYRGHYIATILDDTSLRFFFSSRSVQDTWLVGPRVGIINDWNLGCGWKLIGNADLSLCFQHFKVSFQDFDAAGICSKTHEKLNRLTPNLQLGLGVGYGTYFDDCNYHLEGTLGYDFQVFWNQNYMSLLVMNELFTVLSPIYFNGSKPADLFLHGFTAGLRFDF